MNKPVLASYEDNCEEVGRPCPALKRILRKPWGDRTTPIHLPALILPIGCSGTQHCDNSGRGNVLPSPTPTAAAAFKHLTAQYSAFSSPARAPHGSGTPQSLVRSLRFPQALTGRLPGSNAREQAGKASKQGALRATRPCAHIPQLRQLNNDRFLEDFIPGLRAIYPRRGNTLQSSYKRVRKLRSAAQRCHGGRLEPACTGPTT
jgi:hypothetical protein